MCLEGERGEVQGPGMTLLEAPYGHLVKLLPWLVCLMVRALAYAPDQQHVPGLQI